MAFFSRVSFKKRGRDLAAAAGIVLAAAAILLTLVGNMISDNQKTMIQMQSGQLRSISESVSKQIEVFVDEMVSDLEMETGLDLFEEAERLAAQGDKNLMTQLLMEFMEGREGSVEGMAWENAEQRVESWAENQEPLTLHTASFMTEKEADLTVSILQDENGWCYLKLSKRTQEGNRLSCLLSFNDIYEKTAADIKMGKNGYVMVKSSDGLILMHQVEEQIGQNVLAGRMEMYPDLDFTDLTRLIEHQNQGKGGVEIYNSYWWIEDPPRPVKKVSAYDPARIGDDFLIVSAVIDYADITLPMQKAIVRIVAAAVLLVIFFGLFLLLIGKMFLHQKNVEKENARLKEVNERLEELRQREEAMAHQQRLQLIGTMTGGIAHEFNNLLTPIMGYSAMMLSEMEPQNPYYGDIAEILNSAEKAKEIIGQISSFSGKNAKKSFQELLISQTAAKAMLVAESGKPSQTEISMNLVFEPYWMWGNETQIHQIVLNLCTNAFHAMGESGGRLTVSGVVRKGRHMTENRFFFGKSEQEFYELTFSDTGCGMSEEVKSQIFDPFYTTRKSGEGTGLGLYLVHRMVEEHRGTITVESELGRGTVFRIYFPVFRKEETENA
ncbi:MAG: histidine kinase [Clostridium sp.]|nr:histidine kinase [Clostridium sp.]